MVWRPSRISPPSLNEPLYKLAPTMKHFQNIQNYKVKGSRVSKVLVEAEDIFEVLLNRALNLKPS
jgi:hypothetical protein